jgi:hypothetical protein
MCFEKFAAYHVALYDRVPTSMLRAMADDTMSISISCDHGDEECSTILSSTSITAGELLFKCGTVRVILPLQTASALVTKSRDVMPMTL